MSNDDDNAREALQTLGVGPAARELYVDLIRPAAQETGKNLVVAAKLVTVAMAPLHGLVWGLDKVRDWLSAALLRRLADVTPDDIQSPERYVAGQILLQLPFCADENELRELYANLLAAAMTRTRATAVHPAFVQVIQQLTPDEALILREIDACREPTFVLQESFDERGNDLNDTGSISDQFREFCTKAGVREISLSDAYLENLLRLRILSENRWTEGKFEPAGYNEYGDYAASVRNVDGRLVELGALGERFIQVCLPA